MIQAMRRNRFDWALPQESDNPGRPSAICAPTMLLQDRKELAEMSVRQVQIYGRLFQISMTEQHPNGAQVGAPFQ